MAATFLKTWFAPSKTANGNNKEPATGTIRTLDNEQDPPPIPPARRLSLSKSGKMKRKSYGKQTSVKNAFFAPPPNEVDNVNNSENNNNNSARCSDQADNIDDVIADLMETVRNTKV